MFYAKSNCSISRDDGVEDAFLDRSDPFSISIDAAARFRMPRNCTIGTDRRTAARASYDWDHHYKQPHRPADDRSTHMQNQSHALQLHVETSASSLPEAMPINIRRPPPVRFSIIKARFGYPRSRCRTGWLCANHSSHPKEPKMSVA